MRKNDGWMNALFALIFIAVPAIVGYWQLLPDWNDGTEVVSTGAMWGIAIGFGAYVAILSLILIWTKVLTVDSLNFNVAITLVFIVLFVSSGLPLWARAVLVVVMILVAFPVNMFVNNYKRSQIKKRQ